jgi:hypothetical protein
MCALDVEEMNEISDVCFSVSLPLLCQLLQSGLDWLEFSTFFRAIGF